MTTVAELRIEAAASAAPPCQDRGDVFAFRHDWSRPVVERLEWATAIGRVGSGIEVRRPLRLLPRRFVTLHVGHGRHGDGLVADWLDRYFGVPANFPLPQHGITVLTPAHAGDATLVVSAGDPEQFMPTDHVELHASYAFNYGGTGCRALIVDADGFQAIAFPSLSETLFLSQPLERDFGAGAAVMPLVAGTVDDSSTFVQDAPGIASGDVTIRVAPERFVYTSADDPLLAGWPVWPDGDWSTDPGTSAGAKITRFDEAMAAPWVRRDDPVPTATFSRRYVVSGREAIATWRKRLYRAAGRHGECWIPDGRAPAYQTTAAAPVNATYLLVDGDSSADAFGRGPAAAMIVMPGSSRLYVLTQPYGWGACGVVGLSAPLTTPVPAGSRVVRLSRVRLNHDAVEIHWHSPALAEIPLTFTSVAWQ